MYKLLIVEDDSDIAEAIRLKAAQWDMEGRTVRDFHRVTEEFSDFAPHIVLMDIGLPFFNGYHWCGEIRKISNVPIIFLSSASDNMNIVMAINMGADDFIAKPFDWDVLIAKLHSLLRRTYGYKPDTPALEYRGAKLSPESNCLEYNGESVDLTKNEYLILSCLMKNKGRTVSREALMKALWRTEEFVDENALAVNVARLRKKLSSHGLSDLITTKFGAGYMIGDSEK